MCDHGSHKPLYEDFKENNNTTGMTMDSAAYMTSYYNNYNAHQNYSTSDQAQSVYNNYLSNYSREHGFPNDYSSHQSYYNLNAVTAHKQVPMGTSDESSAQSTSAGYVTSTASSSDTSTTGSNHVKFLDASLEANGLASSNCQNNGEKPPEPYANIIVKAILSTNNNVMQLKDIYSYMIEK